MRPTFENIISDIAETISQRSTCKRLRVGCVIVSTDYRKILSWGYNGNASGLPNACDRDEAGNCGCLHAECNAAINCDSPREIEKFVFITHLPCPTCAKLLINLGNVCKVFYNTEYRVKDSLLLLKSVGIETCHINKNLLKT